MNLDNLIYTRDLLYKAKDHFTIRVWQKFDTAYPASSKAEIINECGSAACVGGFIALSKRFTDMGGTTAPNGAPVLPESGKSEYSAIAEFWGCNWEQAEFVCAPQDWRNPWVYIDEFPAVPREIFANQEAQRKEAIKRINFLIKIARAEMKTQGESL